MARFLLDTSTLIDHSHNREPIRTRLIQLMAGTDEIGVCSVVLAEFLSGMHPGRRAVWTTFVDGLTYWTTSPPAARQAGIWRHDYRQDGITLATTDLLIAAVAYEVGATLITENPRHFPMPELSLLSFR